jgi:sortase A
MTLLQEPTPRMHVPRAGLVRRSLRTLSSVLIVAGVLLLADAALTVAWQEPVSALYARLKQDQLSSQLRDTAKIAPTPLEERAIKALPDDDARLAFQARSLNRRVKKGQPIGRVKMPRIGASLVFVEGTGDSTLRTGPGHYPDTPLPGAPGTTAIAGHRTTYGAPFRRIDKLRKGDEIVVEMPYGRFSYKVESKKIVPPSATYVTRRVKHDRLVLTACHPLYSAQQRIVIFAKLEDQRPATGLL